MPDAHVLIEYRFKLGKGPRRTFQVQLRRPDLRLVVGTADPLPDWTRLEHHQCPNCPLRAAAHPRCPVAAALAPVVEAFRDCLSTETAEITIRAPSRLYRRRAAVQYGVSSLMGLYMVTSGCPILDKLRPMVHTHLPFATIDETTFRVTGMYLLAQYFVQQRGRTPDWNLRQLVHLCEEVASVNQAFARRLLSINPKDASLNALAALDCFTLSTAFSIGRDQLRDLEPLFQAYLDDAGPAPPPA